MQDEILCPAHKTPTVIRPLASQSPEQLWCGTWYDCNEPKCASSVLVQSNEFAEFLAVQMESLKGQYTALKTKKQRLRFLNGCVPSVAKEIESAFGTV